MDAGDTLARIENARAQHGFSIRTICDAAGVSLTAYYKWRAGRGIMPETRAAVRAALRKLAMTGTPKATEKK